MKTAGPPATQPAKAEAVASPASAENPSTPMPGAAVYRADGCAACHGQAGEGTARAPALVGIGSKLSAAQVAALFHNPTAAMTAGGMPPVTGNTETLALLVTYLRSLRAGSSRPPVASAAPSYTATSGKPAAPTAAATKATITGAASPPPSYPPAPKQVAGAGSASVTASASAAQPSAPSNPPGAAIFAAQGCAACHGARGVGTKMAPALAAFGKTLSAAALTNLLQHPNAKMQAGGMPATNIGAPEMSALVEYVQNLGGVATAATGTPSSPAESASQAPTAVTGVPQASSPASVIESQRRTNELELQGKAVFDSHFCSTCHGMNGVGGTWAAPALANTGKNFPTALLITLFQHPTARMQRGGMPPVSVSRGELDALAAYVSSISSAKQAPAPKPR